MNLQDRLFNLFQPDKYNLTIDLDDVKKTFVGIVKINGKLTKTSPKIYLHSEGLEIISAKIDGKKCISTNNIENVLELTSPTLQSGKHLIEIKYSGKITEQLYGIYPSRYSHKGVKKELITTQFESHFARKAFPCIDEPEAKATFDLTIISRQGVEVLSNMPIKKQQLTNSRLVTSFHTSPVISTYLIAWVIGELDKISRKTKSGVDISVWATKNHSKKHLEFALDVAVRAIEFFEDYFKIKYPLPKLDHVAIPDFASGAMENWGLITYRESVLISSPSTSLASKQKIATVIAHEVSHQWFGNLVTMKWWNDLWLNESFANLMEYIAVDHLFPDWQIWLNYAQTEIVSAVNRDSIDGVQPIQVAVSHPDDISTLFDPSIVYAKGGRLLRMLRDFIGDNNFREGLKSYFENNKFANTVANDLWQSLSRSSGKDITEFMNSWITKPGLPLVSAIKDGRSITLKQARFFIGEHANDDSIWTIPLHGSNKDIPEVLSSKVLQFNYDFKEVFYINQSGTSHFISSYDNDLLEAIINSLPNLPVIDRLMFLNNQLLLAKSGEQSFVSLIPIIQRFASEESEPIWQVIAYIISELKKFTESNTQAEKALKKLVASIITKQTTRLGFDIKKDESDNDTKLRRIFTSLALFSGDKSAKAWAKSIFLKEPPAKMHPEYRTAVMSEAVRTSKDMNVISDLLIIYASTGDSQLQDDIAAAVTSAKHLSQIKSIVKILTKGETVRSQDLTHWYYWLLSNKFGRKYMWLFTMDNWNWLEKSMKNGGHFEMLPRYIASTLNSSAYLKQYVNFFKPFENNRSLSRNIKMGAIEINANINKLKRDQDNICDYLIKVK